MNPNGRGGTVNSLDYTRALAKRIKASGATFILDLHYSDTWADPQHQVKPAAWKDLDFDSLQNAVEKYTARVMADLKANDALPQIVQIGNEITGGTLWPDAQVKVPLSMVKVYDSTVKPIEPPQPYDDADTMGPFHAHPRRRNPRCPPINDFRRPRPHHDPHRLRRRLARHAVVLRSSRSAPHRLRYHRPKLLPLLARNACQRPRQPATNGKSFPQRHHHRRDGLSMERRRAWSAHKNMAWPITAAGQQQFMEDLIRTVRKTPDGHGIGVIYWHPEPPAAALERRRHGPLRFQRQRPARNGRARKTGTQLVLWRRRKKATRVTGSGDPFFTRLSTAPCG